MRKRIVAIADMHCGAETGLTPPDWQCGGALGKVQLAHFDWYRARVPKNADAMLVLGDAIDGRQDRNGSVEQITTNRKRQVAIAQAVIMAAAPRSVVMVYGTGYHTGDREDWEDILAEGLRSQGTPVEISAHPVVNVSGCRFDLKHKVGGSQSPHGRHTAIARERLWNVLWAQRGERHMADVVLRAHVHYFQFAGDAMGIGMTMPALQALGSRYGSRECSGTVDFGFLQFDVTGPGVPDWQAHIMPICASKELRV